MIYNKDKLIAALESVRKYVCPYLRSNSCDCKYGAHKGLHLYPQEGNHIRGEVSGCCEIREVQEILLTIHHRELETITQRLISNEFNDPGQRFRKIDAIAKKYGAGIHHPKLKNGSKYSDTDILKTLGAIDDKCGTDESNE